MDDKIAKLQEATDLAHQQLTICKEALEKAAQDLEEAKAKYKNLPQEEQATLQINDTELPELIETHLRAKNVYETVEAKYSTNLRYLEMMKKKQQGS